MNISHRLQPLILLVDDDQEVLDEVASMLTASGFDCQCCATAESAIVAAETILPDLILSDTTLPGAAGVEMCHRIHQDPRLVNVPVMFLSSAQIPDIIRRSDGVRGAYYVRKPVAGEVLLELIDRALGRTSVRV